MGTASQFLIGVVEGFYGRDWSWEVRQRYAYYLQQLGLNTYLYCPKGDTCLRRDWRAPWSAQQRERIEATGAAYAERGLYWGVGLSPYGLYLDYSAAERDRLRQKIDELGALRAPLLGILFDDMPGDLDALAERQADIVNDVAAWLPGVRLLVCPTYYSFDPVLEKHFGAMPANYWADLGRLLPPQADVFWTGNAVCSEGISAADIRRIYSAMERQLILWDNYPVNDGALRSRFLYTRPLPDRDSAMRSMLSGHLCNPMNQALLSLPALAGLASLWGSGGGDEAALAAWLGEPFWKQFQADAALFQTAGLDALGEDERARLAQTYDALGGGAAAEVSGWLREEYRFDPACLTD